MTVRDMYSIAEHYISAGLAGREILAVSVLDRAREEELGIIRTDDTKLTRDCQLLLVLGGEEVE